MKKANKYIGIPGVRYRCRVRRVSAGGLDVLSQFILDHVLDKEDRISVLLQSFGLPRGVIEDALTELLEANRVSLDVLTGRLLKSAVRPDRREYRLDGPLEVWQDEFTGAILPISMVQRFAEPVPYSDEAALLWLHGRKARDLMDLPAARALGSLLTADPTLQADEGGWVADGLVYPEKLGPFDLYLPVDQVEVDGKAIDFVSGKGLPTWVTRNWSFELATSELSGESREARVEQQERIRSVVEEVTSGSDIEKIFGIFKRATLTNIIEGWRGKFEKSLGNIVDFVHQRNSFALEQLKYKIEEDIADFISRILSSGHVRFEHSTSTHLSELWNSAESYLLIAHNGFTVEELDEIWAKTEGNNVNPVHLILLDCSGRETSTDMELWLEARAERESGGEVVFVRTEVNIEGEFSVADGREARFGNLHALLSDEPVVIVQGRTAMQHLTASISKEINPQEAGGWWVLRQLSPALAQTIDICEELKKSLQDFADLKKEVGELIDDLSGSVFDGADSDQAELKGEGSIDIARGKVGQVELRVWEVCKQLLEEFPKHRMFIAPFSGSDLVSVRQGALEIAGAEKGHEINIILNTLPHRLAEGIFIEDLRKVIKAGSVIRFIICPSVLNREPSQNTIGVLEIIKQRLGAENITIEVSSTELPCGLILDKKLVAMGWGDWFDAMGQDVGQFGFIVESEALANQIKLYQSLL